MNVQLIKVFLIGKKFVRVMDKSNYETNFRFQMIDEICMDKVRGMG